MTASKRGCEVVRTSPLTAPLPAPRLRTPGRYAPTVASMKRRMRAPLAAGTGWSSCCVWPSARLPVPAFLTENVQRDLINRWHNFSRVDFDRIGQQS
jgi:hypothetical protein